jgi:peptidoglycan hydrolase CwlO-like protein
MVTSPISKENLYPVTSTPTTAISKKNVKSNEYRLQFIYKTVQTIENNQKGIQAEIQSLHRKANKIMAATSSDVQLPMCTRYDVS